MSCIWLECFMTHIRRVSDVSHTTFSGAWELRLVRRTFLIELKVEMPLFASPASTTNHLSGLFGDNSACLINDHQLIFRRSTRYRRALVNVRAPIADNVFNNNNKKRFRLAWIEAEKKKNTQRKAFGEVQLSSFKITHKWFTKRKTSTQLSHIVRSSRT